MSVSEIQTAQNSALPSLIGYTRGQLTAVVAELGEPGFRVKQLWHWIYTKGARSFSEMTTLSKALREKLSAHYSLDRPAVSSHQVSVDGTQKWLLRFADGQEVETVFIPDEERGTLCVSSQVGCTLTCSFCHTGTQKWARNLSPADIISQLVVARDFLNDWDVEDEERRHITNIVMMGMGEPLFNYENVAEALKVLMDHEGISISKRKITLSTSGVVPLIPQVGDELGVSLAISLHAVRDELRDVLVPLNKKYPIAELLEACRAYPTLSNARRITFEYVMLKDVNDSDDDARALVKLLDGIPAKVNLIPFNPWPGTEYECSDAARIDAFANIVMNAGYPSPIRRPRGQDILAACGQLKSESVRQRKN